MAAVTEIVSGALRQNVAGLRGRRLVYPAAKMVYLSSGTPTFADIGMAAPASSPSPSEGSAGALDGDYEYAVTYVDKDTADDVTESNPSSVGSVSVSSKRVSVDYASIKSAAPSRCTHVRIYRTTNAGSVFYQIAEIAIATASPYVDNDADTDIDSGTLIATDHDAPVAMDGVSLIGTRVWGWKGSTVFFSGSILEPDHPEYWSPLSALYVTRDDGFDIKNVIQLGDSIAVLKERGISLYFFDRGADPLTASSRVAIEDRGLIATNAMTKAGDDLFLMDELGIYAYLGGRSTLDLSSPKIDDLFKRVNLGAKEKFSAVSDQDCVRFFVALDGDTECHHAFVLDLATLRSKREVRWWLEHYDHEIRDASSFRLGPVGSSSIMNGMRQACVLDSYGDVFALDMLTSDGVPADLAHTGTVNNYLTDHFSYDTTDGRNVSAAVEKCYIRFFIDGEWTVARRITQANLSTIEIADPLADIADDTPFIIGGIHQVYRSPVFSPDGPFSEHHYSQLSMAYKPTPYATSIEVKAIRDRRGANINSVAEDVGFWSQLANSRAKSVVLGGALGEGGRGFVNIPLTKVAAHHFEIEFESLLPRNHVEIQDLEFVSVDKGGK